MRTARTVLISGAGIAGPALAYWLSASGLTPTLIELAPSLRTGGFVIDFWGLGYDIAEKMGLAGELNRVGYHIKELRVVDAAGHRVAGFGTGVFQELTRGRFVTLARSDLSGLLFRTVQNRAEILFGEEITALHERADGVEVEFSKSPARRFDLVIGADGLHSKVRDLAFGPQRHFEIPLGYVVAACEVPHYRPRDEGVYVVYSEPGQMIGRLALHDDRTLFLFVFARARAGQPSLRELGDKKAVLRERFAGCGWETARILAELEHVHELYVDRVSQIQIDRWSSGRIALVGDAAFCVSFTAGQGAALAIMSAYTLAGEVACAGGRYGEAFANYEQRLRPYISSKQRAAKRFARAFAPRTVGGIFLRNQVIRMASVPGLARLAIGQDIVETLSLPDYPWTTR